MGCWEGTGRLPSTAIKPRTAHAGPPRPTRKSPQMTLQCLFQISTPWTTNNLRFFLVPMMCLLKQWPACHANRTPDCDPMPRKLVNGVRVLHVAPNHAKASGTRARGQCAQAAGCPPCPGAGRCLHSARYPSAPGMASFAARMHPAGGGAAMWQGQKSALTTRSASLATLLPPQGSSRLDARVCQNQGVDFTKHGHAALKKENGEK